MKNELIVMLTQNDLTVGNALEVFEACKHSKAEFWGMKESPLPLEDMKVLYAGMKACGKTTFLEVVKYSEAEGLEGARIAAECGCDVLMGTTFHDSINEFCQQHGIKYMPFVGSITGRPSVLTGNVNDMIEEARRYIAAGAFGIDLLGYRYTGDAFMLNETFIKGVDAPVCLAGSIDSYERLDEVKRVAPWAFSIGSAFFENHFGGTMAEQIDKVCEYMEKDGNDDVVSYYDSIAGEYDESRFNNSYGRFIDAEERRILDKAINVTAGSQRLEIACGTGRLTNYATCGLDASSEMLEFARKRYPDLSFVNASATATGFADESFDTVYAFHLMMHLDIDTIRQILDEVHRILKPGGHFILDIPSKKRRRILHHKQASWHGGTELSTKEIEELIEGKYRLNKSYGVMMLPVHKLPEKMRNSSLKLDYSLANGLLKEYSSYLVFDIVKQ